MAEYLRKKWGVRPNDVNWYERALRHKSVVGAGKFCHTDCNERLELLGDAVLDTVITEYLFIKYPDYDEGDLTKLRSKIVNRQTLGLVGKSAGLDKMIEARIGNEDSMDKIVGNALEAWLGAIYVDRGFSTAKKSIDRYLIPLYANVESLVEQSFDFKSKLIEWAQQRKSDLKFQTAHNADNELFFTCSVVVNQVLIAQGKERSKKKAEQAAAKSACESLNIVA